MPVRAALRAPRSSPRRRARPALAATLAAALVALLATGAACSGSTTPDTPRFLGRLGALDLSRFPTGDVADDRATLDRLKQQARSLAGTTGCAAGGECSAIGLGERPCGGPSEYVVFCPRTTDVQALREAVAVVARAERAFNDRYGIGSTCDYRTPPALELSAGSCRVAPPVPIP